MNKEDLQALVSRYQRQFSSVIDFEKFNQYAIVHHSTAIEGSSLDLEETYLLLDEQLTPKNKPLEHVYMVNDHYHALTLALEAAQRKQPLSVAFVRQLSAEIMRNTGGMISAMAGDFDSSKGDFRKLSVRVGNRYFMDYKKVPESVAKVLEEANRQILGVNDVKSIYELSFRLHFQMVSIHPFADGNGRLSRLLMNYVQRYHNVPLNIVFKEDKLKYFQVLEESRNKDNTDPFFEFMFAQTKRFLSEELKKARKKPRKGQGF